MVSVKGELGICEQPTDTQVRVNGSIASCASQVLVLTVRNVEVCLRVSVLLSQAKVDDVDLVTTFANTHEEVVRLDITVDKGFGMNVLDTGDKLVGQEEYCLQRELAVAKIEKILQAGTKQI